MGTGNLIPTTEKPRRKKKNSNAEASPAAQVASDFDGLRVFLSHKAKDKLAAQEIEQQLEIPGAGRLEIFLSESIDFGVQWLEEIKKELHASDWLILLYTDPSDNWDWCLYESGYFDGKNAGKLGYKGNRIICLHNEKVEPPDVLSQFQNVGATNEAIEQFLEDMFGLPPREGIKPINHKLAGDPKALHKLANAIIDIIGPEPEKNFLTDHIFISITEEGVQELKEKSEIPGNAEIESNSRSMALFGMEKIKITWRDFSSELTQNNPNLYAAFNETILEASKGRTPHSSLPVFFPVDKNTPYRPVLYRVDKMHNRSQRFKIIFTAIYDSDSLKPKGDLGQIIALLKVCRMFRWGVTIKFIDELKALKNNDAKKEEISRTLKRLWNEVLKVETSSKLEGFQGPGSVISLFDEGERRENIKVQFERWGEFRKALMDATTKSMSADDALKALDGCNDLVKDFMVMAALKYAELLKKSY